MDQKRTQRDKQTDKQQIDRQTDRQTYLKPLPMRVHAGGNTVYCSQSGIIQWVKIGRRNPLGPMYFVKIQNGSCEGYRIICFTISIQILNSRLPEFCIHKDFTMNSLSSIRFDSYVQYLSYDILTIAEMPNNELTSNHTLSLPPLHL